MRTETGKKAKKGLFRVIFSRTAMIIVLLVLQIAVMVGAVTLLGDYQTYIYGGSLVLSAILVIYIINAKGNPAFKLTWILCILVIPIFGAFFYIFVKTQIGTRYIGKRLEVLRAQTDPYMGTDADMIERLRVSKPANANLAHYLANQVSFPVYQNTEAVYFPIGEDKFEEMKKQLQMAEHFIFLEYFIIEESRMLDEVVHILERKVEEGVEVRFMYDGMCSMALMPYDYPKRLKRKGIRCKMFSPIKPVLSTYQNNRDHRKICVIDGKVGITGGINLGDEYINEKERFGHWKDTSIMLTGDAVQSLTMLFLQMWNVGERGSENYEKYLTPKAPELKKELGFVIPYGDSPFDNENVGEEVYFHILNHAKKYVHIMTPYLILDNEMITTLTRTAKCGIEVIIIMPHIPDKKYAFYLAKTYYEELIEASVQIYEYTPGFVHAKVFVSDDDTATVGTINLDFRSLYLHFECGVFVYNNPVVDKVEKDFQETLAKCQKISLMEARSRTFKVKAVGEVLRLIAPLM